MRLLSAGLRLNKVIGNEFSVLESVPKAGENWENVLVLKCFPVGGAWYRSSRGKNIDLTVGKIGIIPNW